MKRVGIVSSILLVVGFAALAGSPTPSPPPDASASRRGLVNTGSQTFGGLKTFIDGGISTTTLSTSSLSVDGGVIVRGFDVPLVSTATQSLFVDPLGNDSNPCTGTGAQACLTLQGALQRLPRFISHNTTVSIAPGTYAETFRLQGFFVGGGPGSSTEPTLTVSGSQIPFTPATGSATGTVTSYTGVTSGSHAVIQVSGATWTTNDLRGRFVTITSGPGSGEYHLISSNTANSISLVFPFTVAPTGASSFSITTPGAIFTGVAASVRGITGSGNVLISDISIQPTSGTAFNATAVEPQLTTTRIRIVGVTSGVSIATSPAIGPRSWTINQSMISANSGSGLAWSNQSRGIFTELFILCTGTCAGSGLFNQPLASSFSSVTGTIAGVWNTALLNLASNPFSQSTGLWLDCGSASNVGILISAPNDSSVRSGTGWAQNTGPYFNGCLTAYSLNSPSLTYVDNGTVFTNVTNAIIGTGGARIIIEAGTTQTSVTNFLTLDGTVYTDNDLTTLTRITTVQGTHATRP